MITLHFYYSSFPNQGVQKKSLLMKYLEGARVSQSQSLGFENKHTETSDMGNFEVVWQKAKVKV